MVTPKKSQHLEGFRAKLANFVESDNTVRFITFLIIINSITLGLETDPELVSEFGSLLFAIDKTILVLFSIELLIKFYAYRLSFFRSGWNVFDLLIVAIAWIPSAGAFSVIRALRILRVLRLLTVVPQLRRVIGALLHSIPGMISVGGILMIIFYVCAVLSTSLFGKHPDLQMQEWFGSVTASLYTLFQIMTLESWSMGIVRPTMELFPLSWLFFVPFIIITSFAVLNLFIGIIVDAMQTAQERPREDDKAELKQFTQQEMESFHEQFSTLKKELISIKEMIKKNSSQ